MARRVCAFNGRTGQELRRSLSPSLLRSLGLSLHWLLNLSFHRSQSLSKGFPRLDWASYLVWASLFLLLAACSPRSSSVAAVPTTTIPSAPAASTTPTGVVVLPSTATPTELVPTDTPTPAASPSPQPTDTPQPTSTPTPFHCSETVGRVVAGEFPSPTQNTNQPYLIYLPPCYGQIDKLYPTLYLFHGNIYTERHWIDIGIDKAADAGIASGTLPPFIIVLPFDGEIANNTSGGDRSFEGVVLNDLIPYIEDQYCVWDEPEGRAIGGLSRGGYWSLEIAFRHPELFSSVGGHSAAIFEDNAGPVYNPLTTGLDPKLIGLPIYMDVGEYDWLRDGVIELHSRMSEAGIPHEWRLNPGEHSDQYWREHSAEYLVWYASHWPHDPSDYPSAGGRSCTH